MNTLERYDEMNRRNWEQAQARSDAVTADMHRRNAEAQQRDRDRQAQQAQGHGGAIILLLLVACVLSYRIRRGLGFGVLLLGIVALVAWASTGISGSQDAQSFAMLWVLGLFGAGIWVVATVGAWLLKIATVDVTQDFISPE